MRRFYTPPTRTAEPPRQPAYSEDCRYFANGICSKGNACKFKHDEATRNTYVCQFFLAGKCSFGHTCRFKHERPSPTDTVTPTGPPPPTTVLPTTTVTNYSRTSPQPSSSSSTVPLRVRPVRLEKPGLNVKAPEFVPSWMQMAKKEEEEPKVAAPGLSYAAATAASVSKESMSSMSQDVASRIMCPYHEAHGDCNRKDDNCPFAHGDICDMCNQWSLHPTDEELRERHREACLQRHQEEMERAFLLQESAKKACGVCMEVIVEKNLRFGILNNCRHCFCLNCIREWRTRDLQDQNITTNVVRSCPECRQHSDYVIPSLFWVEGGKEKETLIAMYKDNMKAKVCKYYSSNGKDRGNCKFGSKCFYRHQRPDGTIDPGRPPHARRRPRLAEFIFPAEYYYSSEESEIDDDELFENFAFFQERAAREAEMLAYADEIAEGSVFEEEFYQAIRNMILEAQETGHGEPGEGSP